MNTALARGGGARRRRSPVGYCMAPEAYATRFSPTTDESVLYSTQDSVLNRYFTVGQRRAARLPAFGQRAVGANGGPGAGRGCRWTSSTLMYGFDHGDYWSGAVSEIASVIDPRHDEAQRHADDVLPSDAPVRPADPPRPLAVPPHHLRNDSLR